MNKIKNNSKRWIAAGVLTLLCYGLSAGFISNLVSPAWIPVVSAVILAVATGVWMALWWRRVTGSVSRIANWVCHLVCATGAILVLLLIVNHFGGGEPKVVKAEVVSTYTSTGYHTRRVRQGVYVRGEPYTIYHVKFRLPDGQEKSLMVGVDRYLKLKRASSMDITLRRGLLGMDYYRL